MDIKDMKFFEDIDENVIRKIETNCSRKIYKESDTIFEKGDPADFLYFLEQGAIDLFLKEKNMTICTLDKPGEVFGWSSIIEDGVYTSSSLCKTDTKVLQIPRDAVKEIFNRHPDAAVTFYQRIGSVFSKRLTTVID